MREVIVTGATSMLGAAVVRECVKNGVHVYAVVRPRSEKLNRLPDSRLVTLVETELEDYGSLAGKIRKQCDVLYHFAWGGQLTEEEKRRPLRKMNQVEYNMRNIGYTLEALKAAAALGCRKFIGAGSQAEYGVQPPDVQVDGSTMPNPVTAYGTAKYAAGKAAMLKAGELGMDCIWVRIYSVYGEYDRESTMLTYAIRKLLCGEKAEFTWARQLWDYLYSGDAGRAYYLIGEVSGGSKVYRLASGESRPLYEYIEAVKRLTGSRSELVYGVIPEPGQPVNLNVTIGDLTADTGFVPRISFEEGIRRLISSLKKEKG